MMIYKKIIIIAVFAALTISVASAGFLAKASIGDILTPQYWKNLLFPQGAPSLPAPPIGGSPTASPPAIISQPGSVEPILDYEAARIAAVKRVSPTVVSIIVTKDLPVLEHYYINPFGDDFFNQFFSIPQYREKGTEKREVGGGTGFIISSDGLILTNRHVVQDEKAEYTVLTNDEKKYPAKVLARDPILDLAVLKIEKNGLPTVVLGDSDKLELAQTVIAIGNALGEFRNTVSVGVVSGLSRQVTASGGGQREVLKDVIQTDAAINPGNSGGPLLNLKGEVIGVNVAMVSGAQSIGFAIPINQAKSAIESVKKEGRIITPYIGVRYIIIDETVKGKNNLTVDYGALVVRGETREDLAVIPGSPADKAGIVENDIILEIDGQKITQDNNLAFAIRTKKVGGEITLKILSKGTEKTVKVILEERK